MTELLSAAPWLYGLALWTHLTAVTLSISLFTVRGLGVAWGQRWPMVAFWRWTSVVIDTVLLSAGASLWALIQRNPLNEPWLGAKLLLLPLYVVLGSFALKRAKTRTARILFFVAALTCVLTMVSIARTRLPLGWWTP